MTPVRRNSASSKAERAAAPPSPLAQLTGKKLTAGLDAAFARHTAAQGYLAEFGVRGVEYFLTHLLGQGVDLRDPGFEAFLGKAVKLALRQARGLAAGDGVPAAQLGGLATMLTQAGGRPALVPELARKNDLTLPRREHFPNALIHTPPAPYVSVPQRHETFMGRVAEWGTPEGEALK